MSRYRPSQRTARCVDRVRVRTCPMARAGGSPPTLNRLRHRLPHWTDRAVESKGVDLWGKGRWQVYRLNNLSHKTLTVNGRQHRPEGMAEITAHADTVDDRSAPSI